MTRRRAQPDLQCPHVRRTRTEEEAAAVLAEARPPLYRRRVDFFTKSRAFSIEKARRLLGYRPEVRLADGIRETMDWYVAHDYLQPKAQLEAAYQQ